jgi:hypothetical protein
MFSTLPAVVICHAPSAENDPATRIEEILAVPASAFTPFSTSFKPLYCERH